MTFNPPTFLPPVLAIGQANASNGRQQLGSGLVTHRGIIDMNSLRVQGNLYPQSGRGLELTFSPTSSNGSLQCYDRDTSAWLDLNINGKNINLNANGGKVSLPAGTAQQVLGSYRNLVNWNIPATSVWYESPVQCNVTATGGLLRLEATGFVSHSVATAIVYVGFMLDGASAFDSQALAQPTIANANVPYSIIAYHQTAAGPHRWSVMLYTPSGGPAGMSTAAYQTMYVTEQRA